MGAESSLRAVCLAGCGLAGPRPTPHCDAPPPPTHTHRRPPTRYLIPRNSERFPPPAGRGAGHNHPADAAPAVSHPPWTALGLPSVPPRCHHRAKCTRPPTAPPRERAARPAQLRFPLFPSPYLKATWCKAQSARSPPSSRATRTPPCCHAAERLPRSLLLLLVCCLRAESDARCCWAVGVAPPRPPAPRPPPAAAEMRRRRPRRRPETQACRRPLRLAAWRWS